MITDVIIHPFKYVKIIKKLEHKTEKNILTKRILFSRLKQTKI